jgi:hypothetical protein
LPYVERFALALYEYLEELYQVGAPFDGTDGYESIDPTGVDVAKVERHLANALRMRDECEESAKFIGKVSSVVEFDG